MSQTDNLRGELLNEMSIRFQRMSARADGLARYLSKLGRGDLVDEVYADLPMSQESLEGRRAERSDLSTTNVEHELAKAIHLLHDHKILNDDERERCAVRWFNGLHSRR